jgi:hypothetical protein
VNGYHLRSYLQSQKRWSDEVWDTIDFQLFGKQYCRLPFRQQITRTKFVYDQLPLGDRRFKQAPVKDPLLSLCPCCKSTAETTNHLIRCQSCPQRASSVKAMKAAICPSDYHPARYVILAGILHWLDHEDSVPFNPSLSEYDPVFLPLLQDAIKSQASIGWGNALKGFLANLGERLPVTIFTTRDDWTLRMAKLDYDQSSMRPTSSRGQSGFQETLLFTIKQMLI